jgi:hypothetical protein
MAKRCMVSSVGRTGYRRRNEARGSGTANQLRFTMIRRITYTCTMSCWVLYLARCPSVN